MRHRKPSLFRHDSGILTFDREPSDIAPSEAGDDDDSNRRLSTNDLFIKDAFLVFRALCKLTMKPLTPERWARTLST